MSFTRGYPIQNGIQVPCSFRAQMATKGHLRAGPPAIVQYSMRFYGEHFWARGYAVSRDRIPTSLEQVRQIHR
jgi:hypothetical protein